MIPGMTDVPDTKFRVVPIDEESVNNAIDEEAPDYIPAEWKVADGQVIVQFVEKVEVDAGPLGGMLAGDSITGGASIDIDDDDDGWGGGGA